MHDLAYKTCKQPSKKRCIARSYPDTSLLFLGIDTSIFAFGTVI